jgi:UDP-N-acetylglucosamine:LPS N-acetylglucosamine transferase
MMRIVILTAATGHGHVAAARALAEAVRARGGQAESLDVGAAHPLVGALVSLYNACLRRPPRWMTPFFHAVNAARLDRLAYRAVARWALGEVRRARPTAFISVHPMVNYGLAETLASAGMDIPFAIVLTDLAPPFWRGWAERRAALTTAPTPEALGQLAAWGIPRDRLRLAPIPITPRFRRSDSAQRRQATRRALGLAADRFTVAISPGTACRPAGLQAYRALAAAADLAGRIQVLFLAGRDPRLRRRAQRVAPPFPAAVLPWRDDPATLLAAADVLFTKPGGLTVTEALAAGVPLLLDACGGILPQERGGATWVAGRGAGWIVDEPRAVPAWLRRLRPGEWAAARQRARAAVRGDAGAVLEVIAAGMGSPARAAQPRARPAGAPGLAAEPALRGGREA